MWHDTHPSYMTNQALIWQMKCELYRFEKEIKTDKAILRGRNFFSEKCVSKLVLKYNTVTGLLSQGFLCTMLKSCNFFYCTIWASTLKCNFLFRKIINISPYFIQTKPIITVCSLPAESRMFSLLFMSLMYVIWIVMAY